MALDLRLRRPYLRPDSKPDSLINADPEEAGDPVEAPPLRALIVAEDDYAGEQLIRYALDREGFCVQVVTTYVGGLMALQDLAPSVLILGINLSDGNGLALLRDARRDLGEKLPILVVSGMRQEATIVRAFELGADDYLTTPFSCRELVARVRRRLGL